MTQPATEARQRAYDNLYAELTRGVSHAQIRHHLVEKYRAAVLREAAEVFRADADETARAARKSYDPDMARVARQFHAVAARLDRMADEETSR
jgi:hypothetical protein